ncbi:hypothetical protein HK102_007891 [Quaeritorhiza haematococci]|nr:hypothetical protein HK102_007891 [Quaeritorhiza haematococci]
MPIQFVGTSIKHLPPSLKLLVLCLLTTTAQKAMAQQRTVTNTGCYRLDTSVSRARIDYNENLDVCISFCTQGVGPGSVTFIAAGDVTCHCISGLGRSTVSARCFNPCNADGSQFCGSQDNDIFSVYEIRDNRQPPQPAPAPPPPLPAPRAPAPAPPPPPPPSPTIPPAQPPSQTPASIPPAAPQTAGPQASSTPTPPFPTSNTNTAIVGTVSNAGNAVSNPPTPNTVTRSNDSEDSGVGRQSLAAILFIIPAIVLISIGIAALWFWRYRRKQRENQGGFQITVGRSSIEKPTSSNTFGSGSSGSFQNQLAAAVGGGGDGETTVPDVGSSNHPETSSASQDPDSKSTSDEHTLILDVSTQNSSLRTNANIVGIPPPSFSTEHFKQPQQPQQTPQQRGALQELTLPNGTPDTIQTPTSPAYSIDAIYRLTSFMTNINKVPVTPVGVGPGEGGGLPTADGGFARSPLAYEVVLDRDGNPPTAASG